MWKDSRSSSKNHSWHQSGHYFFKRIDAVDLLRQQQPTCLFGIGLHNETVHYRFLDEQLIDQLLTFLSSKNEKLKFPLSAMEKNVETFRSKLGELVQPARQQRLLLYSAERQSHATLPNASVTISQTSRGGCAFLSAPWVGGAFLLSPEAQESIRGEFFGLGTSPFLTTGIALQPTLQPFLDLGDPQAVIKGRIERVQVVQVIKGDQSAEAIFMLRNFGDEWALTHPTGLCLIWSERRHRSDGQAKHDLYLHLAKGSMSVGALQEQRGFFDLLRPGSFLIQGGEPMIPIDSWPKTLAQMGEHVEELERAYSALGLDLSTFYLADGVGTEFAASLFYVNALLMKTFAPSELFPGFVFGD